MSVDDLAPSSDTLIYLSILRRIPRARWISSTELRRQLSAAGIEMSPRRLQRYLKALSSSPDLGVECRTGSKPYGYRRTDTGNDTTFASLLPHEGLLLRLAREHLRYQLPRELTDALAPLFDAAIDATASRDEASRANAWLKKVSFVSSTVPMVPPDIKPRIFDVVSEALYKDVKLRIRYRNVRDEEREAAVSPLGLVQQDVRLYLVCRFEGYDDVRHLALHRLLDAEILDCPVDRPEGFDLDSYVAQRHFNYANRGKIRLILEFTSAETARNLKETPFVGQTSFETLPDGAWRVEAVVDDTVILDGWIAAWRERAGMRRVEKIPLETERPA
ncbi:helix-turn-helix transcriptional regulator [Sutterella megalosphaeroides]|uniref:WYL domain-containing protein n=1 Tax=Sutterella megalosphaeroides TaxID=2494234 RepID=A0A2Z6I9N7_9BURK|nr:WYL domain-containing protein [Sutterella megalosphaeroides]BBF23223.1 hypothetical protein SUTMEG_11140 [Sutterella megalosphaeroides]